MIWLRHGQRFFFERAKPNQLWHTDLFTFELKRQNRRVYLVATVSGPHKVDLLASFGRARQDHPFSLSMHAERLTALS